MINARTVLTVGGLAIAIASVSTSAMAQAASDWNTPGAVPYPTQRYYPQHQGYYYQQPQYIHPKILRKQAEMEERVRRKYGYQQPQYYYPQPQPRYYQPAPQYYYPQPVPQPRYYW